jgi:hypothetical protein
MSDLFTTARAKPERCRILLDGVLADEHAQLEDELAGADESARHMLAERIVDVEEQIRKAEIEFVFVAIGRGKWRRLQADHPPSEDERAQGIDFSVDDFPFEAMSASLVEPRLTVAELRRLNDEVLTFEQYSLLWATCLAANVGVASRPESLAARAILANGGGKSQLPSDSESAAVS